MTTTTDNSLLVHDHAQMLSAIHSLPAQLPDGYERAKRIEAELQKLWPQEDNCAPRTLIVCGMGGSGVGADLLPAAADVRCPVIAVKGYDIPTWASSEDRVICVSYSGSTAETLSCFDQAAKRSLVSAVITTGGELAQRAHDHKVPVVELPSGMQPRAGVGVIFGALIGVAEHLNVVRDAKSVVDQAALGVQRVVDKNSGDEPAALALAKELHDHVVIVYGADHTQAVAQRWKAQINENSKVPCFSNAYPELDHNEIVGWEYARATGARWALVELMPLNPHPAIVTRFDVTKELMSSAIDVSLRFDAQSLDRAGATFEQLAWGDYVSVFLALIRGIDPTPVDRIHALKAKLTGR